MSKENNSIFLEVEFPVTIHVALPESVDSASPEEVDNFISEYITTEIMPMCDSAQHSSYYSIDNNNYIISENRPE